MRVSITSRHFKVSDSIKLLIEGEFERFKRYTSKINNLEVILEENSKRKSVEIKMNVNKSLLKVKAEDYDLIKAIENSIEKMERRVKRHIGKSRRRRKG